MQKNWYVVHTKPNYENRASQLLTKKGIQNFCAKTRISTDLLKKNKIIEKPLFPNYVFVYIHLSQAKIVKQTMGIINFAFWKGKPAVIDEQEIQVIKDFTSNYENIKLEKATVNEGESLRYIEGPNYTVDGNIFTSKNKNIKIYLPSLGFTMTCKVHDESFYQKETIFSQKNSFTHS